MWAKLYTRYQFDSEEKIDTVLELIEREGGPFVPDQYGIGEPVRNRYKGNRQDVIKLLLGPNNESGTVFLKGTTDALSVITWIKQRRAKWEFYLEDTYLSASAHVSEFTNFITKVCREFEIEYGWAAPEEDWRAKHWRSDYDEKGHRIGRTKVGADLDSGLPGIYWLTAFGSSLAKKLGNDSFSALPVYEVLDFGDGGKAILLRESPYEPSVAERLKQDRTVAQELGAEYFFDIEHPDKRLVKLLETE
jgi:hypothetical protein